MEIDDDDDNKRGITAKITHKNGTENDSMTCKSNSKHERYRQHEVIAIDLGIL